MVLMYFCFNLQNIICKRLYSPDTKLFRSGSVLNPDSCRKPPSYVPYKGTYVPYDGTFGVPDQGQMLDM